MIDALRRIVGDAHVITDPAVTHSYAVDWTGRFAGSTPAVVRPGSTEEVAAIVAACNERGIAIVPQGGNTGLVGGSVPLDGEVVLSLARLATDVEVDSHAGQLTATAGTTIATVQRAATAAGWTYGVDWAARDTATVGGSVASNAGGLRVLRYGDTRTQLLGVEAVLADGSVISHLGGLLKDNTGYHLPSLLCGSEGTLAIVTKARLRLVPAQRERVVALMGYASADSAIAATGHLRRSLPTLEACELFFDDGMQLVCDTFGLPYPLARTDHEAFLLVECASDVDPAPALAAAVEVDDVAVATDAPRRAELWRYREAHTEALNLIGPPHKLDVTLPGGALAEFVERVRGVCSEGRCWLFGHAADGNLHVNITGVDPDDEHLDDVVLKLVAELGGSISAEHGIGTAKKRWLHLNRTPEELAAFRAIKHALDPNGILNPNVLFP